jgi:hypothetical protein
MARAWYSSGITGADGGELFDDIGLRIAENAEDKTPAADIASVPRRTVAKIQLFF